MDTPVRSYECHKYRKGLLLNGSNSNNCLGLVGEAYEELCATVERSGAVLPSNEASHCGDEDLVKRFLDCAVIEFLHTLRADEHRPPLIPCAERSLKAESFIQEHEFPPGRIFSGVCDPLESIVGYFRVTTMAQE